MINYSICLFDFVTCELSFILILAYLLGKEYRHAKVAWECTTWSSLQTDLVVHITRDWLRF